MKELSLWLLNKPNGCTDGGENDKDPRTTRLLILLPSVFQISYERFDHGIFILTCAIFDSFCRGVAFFSMADAPSVVQQVNVSRKQRFVQLLVDFVVLCAQP